MASLFEAYITNLGKYNEGELVGETLKFPTTTEEVQALLKRIGVDGVRYEEFFISCTAKCIKRSKPSIEAGRHFPDGRLLATLCRSRDHEFLYAS